MKTKLVIIVFLLAFSYGWSQQTTAFTEANRAFKQGIDLFDKGVYGAAQNSFQQALDLLNPLNEAEFDNLKNQAQLYLARCAVRQNLPDGEKIMLDFIRSIAPDPASNEALVELANYYFNAKEYDKAIQYYDQTPINSLSQEVKAEVLFKQGYAYFTKQQFGKAKNSFSLVKNIQGEYYYPTHYYLGLVHFFDGSYSDALQSFQIVDRSTIKKYKAVLPYYIAQIYFVEARYDELLSYAVPKLNEGGLSNVKEIYQLVGQTYFERKQYTNALPYLEYYAERSTKMREEEFYQLGYVYMESRQPEQAIKYFKELNAVDSELGQNASYNLGRMYVQVRDKNSAKAAFSRASRMAFNADVQSESLYNYAKLSYELKQDQDAITALQSITPSSKYYKDAQSLMAQILLDTHDYERALTTLKSMQPLTPELREVLQKVNYYRGIQLLQTKKTEEAKTYFNASLENPVSKEFQALSYFWLGDIAYRAKDYAGSSRQMNQFLTIARGLKNLPAESSLATANYIQGYNYLKQQNYTGALSYFQSAIKDFNNNLLIQDRKLKDQLLGDAILRAGDCHFKRNQYNDAIKYYDEAITKKSSDYVYALYQKAIIEGLRGNITEKILSLERLADQHRNSPYADDALLQLGVTYQEVGKLELAAGQLQRLVSDFKNKSELVNQALLQLGLVNYNQGKKEEALNYYKQVFGNNPEPSEAQSALRALEEIYVNDLGNADAYFAFLKTIPGYDIDVTGRDSINFRAAEAQFENGNYRKAVENYTNYISKFPKGQNIILAYYRRGDSNSALKLYSNALTDYEYVVNRGQNKYYAKCLEKAAIIAYNHEQDFKRAYGFYAKLEEVAENNDIRLEAQLGALRSAYRANLTNEVFELAKRVAENPLANQEQVASANFFYGKISYDRKDYDNALRAFEQVTKLSDNEQTAEARYLIAYIYYIRRDLEKAQEITLNSNRESSSYPYWVAKSVILLSDILTEKGDLFNARAALEALLDNYDGDADLVQAAKDKLAQVNKRINAGSRIDNATPNNFIDEGTGNNN